MSSASTSDSIAIAKECLFYSSVVIIIIGIIGNTLNILVFSNLKLFRGNICCFYLIFESIINMAAMFFTFISNILSLIDNNSVTYSIVWCKIKAMLAEILVPISLSTVCFAAMDQFISTSPLCYIRQFSTIRLARCCVLLAACFWIVHSIPVGIFSNMYWRNDCFPANPIFARYYLYFYYPVLLGIFPVMISSIFSLSAFRNVRRIVRRQMGIVRRRLDQQMTAMIFARVIVLVILYIPHVVYYIYSFSSSSSNTTNFVHITIIQLIRTVIYNLVFLNNAITFYVFLATSTRYRRQVKHVLVKKLCRQCKHQNRKQIHPEREKSTSVIE